MAMLSEVKKALRVTAAAYDSEIRGLMLAAEADIFRVGIVRTSENAALVDMAITTFCKAHFGYSDDTERYTDSYNRMLYSLAVSYGGSSAAGKGLLNGSDWNG